MMPGDPAEPEFQSLSPADRDQLRLLSVFYYVLAGLTALVSLFPVIHLAVGAIVVFGGIGGNEPLAALFGGFFVVVALLMIGAGLAFAACMVVVGRSLVLYERYIFCIVIAALATSAFPVGTALGVFTIIVLMREPVKQAFGYGSGQGTHWQPMESGPDQGGPSPPPPSEKDRG